MKPKGKRGVAAVKRLGRRYKTGGFQKIEDKAFEFYRKKGYSVARAKKVAKEVAAKVYWGKVHKRGK